MPLKGKSKDFGFLKMILRSSFSSGSALSGSPANLACLENLAGIIELRFLQDYSFCENLSPFGQNESGNSHDIRSSRQVRSARIAKYQLFRPDWGKLPQSQGVFSRWLTSSNLLQPALRELGVLFSAKLCRRYSTIHLYHCGHLI